MPLLASVLYNILYDPMDQEHYRMFWVSYQAQHLMTSSHPFLVILARNLTSVIRLHLETSHSQKRVFFVFFSGTSLPAQSSSDSPKVVLVFFIGGCTFAEISALRFLSQQEESDGNLNIMIISLPQVFIFYLGITINFFFSSKR